MARRRQKERISLPWEKRRGRWSTAIRNPRWQAWIGGALLVVAAVTFARYARHRVRVRDTKVAIAHLKDAIERFRADMGRCPSSDTELLHPPRSQTHYLDAMPMDGWGRPFTVRCPGYFRSEAEVVSAGPSGSLLQDDNIQ